MKIRSPRLIRFAARILAGAFRLLFRTVRLDIVTHPRTSPYEDTGDDRYIICLWHDGIVGWVFSKPATNVAGLVSRHADGSYLADGMEMIGVVPIRGSSRRGGAAALRQMLDAVADYHIAIATDGPQGPRHVVKEGIIFLASRTGKAIVPAAFEARWAWRPRGRWTDLVIPLPFTRTYIRAGEPILVPPDLTREQFEPYRRKVQDAMDELSAQVRELAGRGPTSSARRDRIPANDPAACGPARRAA